MLFNPHEQLYSFIPTWRTRSDDLCRTLACCPLTPGLRQVGTAGYILANPYSQVDRGTPSFSLVQDLPSYIASSQMQQISELYNETCAVDRWSLVPPKLVCQEASGNEHWETIWISVSFDVCGILWVLPYVFCETANVFKSFSGLSIQDQSSGF